MCMGRVHLYWFSNYKIKKNYRKQTKKMEKIKKVNLLHNLRRVGGSNQKPKDKKP